jgi:hypothetical protein
MKWLLVIALIAALGYAGHWYFRGRGEDEAARIEARVLAGAPPVARTDLPMLVEAFVKTAGVTPEALGRTVALTQEAEMQMRPGGGWSPMTARQTISAGEAGFAWVATQTFGPLPLFRVIDSFVAGKGGLVVRLFGSFPIVRAEGADMDRGEVMRYLAELPWFPDAILGNGQLVWRLVAPREVSVAIDMPGGPAAVRFLFDETGDISEMRADDRPVRGDDGTVTTREWRGYFRDYRLIGGRRVPNEGEVGYVTDGAYAPYWKGRITGYTVDGAGG